VRLTFDEFVYQTEWYEAIRLAGYLTDSEAVKRFTNMVRAHKRGRPLFGGPYGDRSEWAAICRAQYSHYLAGAA
jgi:hypothetical protein